MNRAQPPDYLWMTEESKKMFKQCSPTWEEEMPTKEVSVWGDVVEVARGWLDEYEFQGFQATEGNIAALEVESNRILGLYGGRVQLNYEDAGRLGIVTLDKPKGAAIGDIKIIIQGLAHRRFGTKKKTSATEDNKVEGGVAGILVRRKHEDRK